MVWQRSPQNHIWKLLLHDSSSYRCSRVKILSDSNNSKLNGWVCYYLLYSNYTGGIKCLLCYTNKINHTSQKSKKTSYGLLKLGGGNFRTLGEVSPQKRCLNKTLHSSQHPKRHQDRFSRFCRAHDCDRQTDWQTNLLRLCSNKLHIAMQRDASWK